MDRCEVTSEYGHLDRMKNGEYVAYVYGLLDPRDGDLRYVGCAAHLKQKKKTHRTMAGGFRLRAWKQELRDMGLAPVFRILVRLTGRSEIYVKTAAYASETKLISRGMERWFKAPLLNDTVKPKRCSRLPCLGDGI